MRWRSMSFTAYDHFDLTATIRWCLVLFILNLFFFCSFGTIKRVGHRNIISIKQNQTHIIFSCIFSILKSFFVFSILFSCLYVYAYVSEWLYIKRNQNLNIIKVKPTDLYNNKKRKNFFFSLWFYRGRIQFAPEIKPFFFSSLSISLFLSLSLSWGIEKHTKWKYAHIYLTKEHARGVPRWISWNCVYAREICRPWGYASVYLWSSTST